MHGRHARLDPADVALSDNAAQGTGRRRRPTGTADTEANGLQQPIGMTPEVCWEPGSGRRRRPGPGQEPSAEAPLVASEAPASPGDPALVALKPGSGSARHRAPSRRAAQPRHRAGPADRPDRRRIPPSLAVPRTSPAMVGGVASVVAGAAALAITATGGFPGAGVEQWSEGSKLSVAADLDGADTRAEQAVGDVSSLQGRASRDLAREKLTSRQKALGLQSRRAARERARETLLARSYVLPVRGYRIAARFGEISRLWSRSHTGLDFACPSGTPIRAIAGGTIVSTGWAGAYGWRTVERLPDGTEIWYAHQSGFVVRRGQVAAGEVIGRVGSTGNSTGNHVHVEIRVNGRPVNPEPWLRARGLHV